MTGQNTNNLSDAIRNLIVCDTQFGWTGETTLKLPELLDLQARGWLIEGDENCEFSLTDEGQAVVARALQQHAPAELAEQQGDALIDTALGYLSTALDDLDSSPDRRPGIMVTEAMQALREAIATRQPGAQEPVGQVRTRVDGGFIAELFPGVADRVSNMAPLYVAPPAQGINLTPVRSALQAAEGLCVCCAAVDSYSRSELRAFGLNMRSQFLEALTLIDQRDAASGVDRG